MLASSNNNAMGTGHHQPQQTPSSPMHRAPSDNHDDDDGTSHHSSGHFSQHSHNSRGSSGTKEACFFADMTLDLEDAHLESTPRTDLKFASMAAGGSIRAQKYGDGREIPGLPLFESKNEHEVPSTPMNNPAQDDDRPLARISSMPTPSPTVDSSTHSSIMDANNNPHQMLPRRLPRRPRDVSWTAGAVLFLPLGLILPHVYYSNRYIEHHNQCDLTQCTPLHPSWAHAASASSTHPTILLSSMLGMLFSIALTRFLYSSRGGGDGDDSRYVVITRTLILSSNLNVLINPLLVFMIWEWLPSAKHVALLPLALVMRDVWRARNTGSALPSFRGRGLGSRSTSRGGSGTSASSSHDRKTFFRALACVALDILSRSLRRKSFVRVASALLVVQFLCVLLWWSALRVVLSVEIFNEDGVISKFMHAFLLTTALVAGKWATGIIARMLTLIASGGVSSWFAQQNMIVAQVHAREREIEIAEQQRRTLGAASNAPKNNYSANKANARAALHAMPEAYSVADAAVYAVIDFDEGVDDDYEDEGHESDMARYNQVNRTSDQSTGRVSSVDHSSTVKAFLTAGCTISFGSVAQCGLLGGLAQFLWSFCRNVDAMGFFLQSRISNDASGFRGMDIGAAGGVAERRQWKQTMAFWWRKFDIAIRGFVRGHSDLAMSHVAAYFKGYQRAANDVAALIETSGTIVFPLSN
ncbi:hypothetical protein ACHAWX_007494 [Stephanocyclus meneghinianus]